ncbi:hypothetical protein R80B4_00058 [Fibrobacteres bacterium R8-0-B4]
MKTMTPIAERARTAEEIKKAIEERDRQNEADRQELIKAKEREAAAKSEEKIFTYLDTIRKKVPDKLKPIISAGCSSYNTKLAALRSKFRKDLYDLNRRCVADCLEAYQKQEGEGEATPDKFLKLLEIVCPDVKAELEKADDKTIQSKKKEPEENKAPANINAPPPRTLIKE